MNAPWLTFAALLLLPACSLSVGAGAEADLGRRTTSVGAACDSFESCDVAYRAAARRAARCQRSDVTCDDEEREVRLSYGQLRVQTERELSELRRQAQQAELEAQSAREEARAACLNQRRVNPNGSWFEDPAPIPATPTRP